MANISVIVPVFNEEENLLPLYNELKTVLQNLKAVHEIVFVNDGSTDKSLERILELRKKDRAVKIIDFYRNFGQSAALKAGFEFAKNDVIITIDADLQNDPKDIPKMLSELNNGFDCVCGWRAERRDRFLKKIFSKFASALRRPFLGAHVHDYGCTLKVFRNESVKGLEIYGEMHRYIPPLLRWKGYKITEIKVNHRKRIYGKSNYNVFRLYKGFLDMINIWFWQKYSSRPLHVFGGIGLVAVLMGTILGVLLVALRLQGKISLINSSLPLFVAVLFLAGIILFCFGLISDILIKIYYSSGEKKLYNIKKVFE